MSKKEKSKVGCDMTHCKNHGLLLVYLLHFLHSSYVKNYILKYVLRLSLLQQSMQFVYFQFIFFCQRVQHYYKIS